MQYSAVSWANADLQLHEGAPEGASLKQCALSTEKWEPAALDQSRKRSRNHLTRIVAAHSI
jgi:hypothetical protein